MSAGDERRARWARQRTLPKVQRNDFVGSPFVIGCIVAAQQGIAVVVEAERDDAVDDDAPPVTFLAHVVGSYLWGDRSITIFFREVAPPPTGPKS